MDCSQICRRVTRVLLFACCGIYSSVILSSGVYAQEFFSDPNLASQLNVMRILQEAKLRDIVDLNGNSVHIDSLKAVNGGLEVIANLVAPGSVRFGFGDDGTKEYARLTIRNPPIYVPDMAGGFVVEFKDPQGNVAVTKRYTDDPEGALHILLFRTLLSVGKRGADVQLGTVDHSQLVVRSDPSSGSTTVDGYMSRGTAGTWAEVRDGAGEGVTNTDTSFFGYELDQNGGNYQNMIRGGQTFDTSTIGSCDVINSVTLTVTGILKVNTTAVTPQVNLYSFTPAANNVLAASDYSQCGTTPFATAIAHTAWSTVGQNVFTFNADGRAAINQGGITRICNREALYDATNTNPGIAGGTTYYITGKSADTLGTTDDPILTIDYTTTACGSSVGSGALTGSGNFVSCSGSGCNLNSTGSLLITRSQCTASGAIRNASGQIVGGSCTRWTTSIEIPAVKFFLAQGWSMNLASAGFLVVLLVIVFWIFRVLAWCFRLLIGRS